MKILAIRDEFFTADLVELAVAPARAAGALVEIRDWDHESLQAQESQMRIVERLGPAAVPIPRALGGELDHDVLVVQFTPVTEPVLARAPNLKAILINRAGTENIDVEGARARGIRIVTAAGRNSRAVAEYTVGLILAEARGIARGYALLRSGTWTVEFSHQAWPPELKDKMIGFVGYGRIGSLVHQMLGGFECRFQVFDPYLAEPPTGCEMVDLDTLMRTSDFITIHARLTPQSHHLIGARELGLVKPTAFLVNTARGGLIDEEALVEALRTERLAGAGLDVFEHEPLPPDHPLLASPRATITPHLAGTTLDGFREGPRILARALAELLAAPSTAASDR